METISRPIFYLIIFNIIASIYMLLVFIKNYWALRKYLTKQQLKERRKHNGIGMTETMILLTFTICTSFTMGLISSFCLANALDEVYNSVKMFWLIPTIATALALMKMVRISSKG